MFRVWALASLLVAVGSDAGALRASLTCEHAAAPGRVRCDVELRTSGATLRWADASIVSTPDFVAPLKGRVGPRDAAAHDPDLFRWGMGFVARDRGEGEVVVRVRAVVCEGEACRPHEEVVTARVRVGS